MPLDVDLTKTPSVVKTFDFYHAKLVDWLKQQPDLSAQVKADITGGMCYTLTLDWMFHRDDAVNHYIPAGTQVTAKGLTDFFNFPGSTSNNSHRAYFIQRAKDYHDYVCFIRSHGGDSSTIDLTYHNYEFTVINHPRTVEINNYEVQHLNPKQRHYFNNGGELHFRDEKLDLKLFAPMAAEHVEKLMFCGVLWKQNSATQQGLAQYPRQSQPVIKLKTQTVNKVIGRHAFAIQRMTANGRKYLYFYDPNMGEYQMPCSAGEFYVFLNQYLATYAQRLKYFVYASYTSRLQIQF